MMYRHSQSWLFAVCLLLVSYGSALAQDLVERRNGLSSINGRIEQVDVAGIRIRPEGSASSVQIPWDRVSNVSTIDHFDAVVRFDQFRMDIWRARTRIERDSTELAEPLLERLFEQVEGQTHETALIVAEGLLRCRLARGVNVLAVIPAMEVIRLRRSGIETSSYEDLPLMYDADHGLCPHLPPYFVESPLMLRVHRALRDYETHDDEHVRFVARSYQRAIGRVINVDVELPTINAGTTHRGQSLLELMDQTTSPDPALREQARRRLNGLAVRQPPFAHAWSRMAVGLSLLGEPDKSQHEHGLLQLLIVAARHDVAQPYLSGMALRLVIAHYRASGEVELASGLEATLEKTHPNHPARHATISLPSFVRPEG